MKKYRFYTGKLGEEAFLCEININNFSAIPRKGDLINIGPSMEESETYVVVQRLFTPTMRDADANIEFFVKLYDWESRYAEC